MTGQLFIVMLRRPGKGDPRADPYWEFGSFGCTGCHSKNLLHPKNCQICNGDRLAFVQGGHLGPRLLLVTPSVERIEHPGGGPKGRIEVRWDSGQKPFRYDRAPALFESPAPSKPGLFSRLADSIAHTNRPTIEAKWASRFRARASPLNPELAIELQAGFNAAVKRAKGSGLIIRYEDALPWCDCPSTVTERRQKYLRGLRDLQNPVRRKLRKIRRCK